MFELCHAGRVASMALRDGGMIMEAWAVTVHGKATRSRIENILIAETAKRDLEGCACGAGEYLAKSEAKPGSKDIVDFGLAAVALSKLTRRNMLSNATRIRHQHNFKCSAETNGGQLVPHMCVTYDFGI